MGYLIFKPGDEGPGEVLKLSRLDMKVEDSWDLGERAINFETDNIRHRWKTDIAKNDQSKTGSVWTKKISLERWWNTSRTFCTMYEN